MPLQHIEIQKVGQMIDNDTNTKLLT